MDNKVRYICVDGTKGYALVEGREVYDVEFEYRNGEIRNITCSCYCNYPCKHEVAAMLQLRESLDLIEKACGAGFERTGYCAMLAKDALFGMVMAVKEDGSFSL